MFSWILTFLMIPTHSTTTSAVAHPITDAGLYRAVDAPMNKTIETWKHVQNAALDDDEVDPEAIVAGEWSDDGTRPDWGQQLDVDSSEAIRNAQAVLPLDGSLSLKFHDPKRTQHDGIDIKTGKRERVRAAWAGQVLFAECTHGLGGCTVMIRHGNGLSTYYSHLSSRPWVRRGDMVARGQALGLELPNVDHLHFEIRSGRRAVNPLVYVHY